MFVSLLESALDAWTFNVSVSKLFLLLRYVVLKVVRVAFYWWAIETEKIIAEIIGSFYRSQIDLIKKKPVEK